MIHRIQFEWPDLGLSARATLAVELNPELCKEVWDALPIDTIMSNAIVTGGSMYSWAPMLSFAPIRYKEAINKAPIGQLRYSQNTGNKIIIQYDKCTEDVMGAVLGQIDPDDLEIVQRVGKEAWASLYYTKQPTRVIIRRLSETTEGEEDTNNGLQYGTLRSDAPMEALHLLEDLQAEITRAYREEPEELRRVRLGLNEGMGSYGQYFGTWEFTYSELRDLAMYTLYPIAKIARKEDFSFDQMKLIYHEIIPTYTNFLGSCGLHQLRNLFHRFQRIMELDTCSKEDFQTILNGFCIYTNALSAWAYFHYPWHIGMFYRFPADFGKK